MKIANDIKYIGVNDHKIDLFEGQYPVPNGISYNSYVIIDERIAVMDSVDVRFTDEWLSNLGAALNGRSPDYLVVHHMEPDHSASITAFIARYPDAKIVASQKAFGMMKSFFGTDMPERQIIVKEGDIVDLGKHKLSFIAAPMVHWPEVMMSYELDSGILFSADAFGKFGALDVDGAWDDEARRYYIGIVGKYGAQVQALLKKAAGLDIKAICPLHGPVLREDIGHYIGLYDIWSSYRPESEGVTVVYASIYGNTAKAAQLLAHRLEQSGASVSLYDLARCNMSSAISDAFRYDKLVIASSTYNADVFPPVKAFIEGLAERGFSNRKVAIIENGSWAPMAAKVITGMLEKCKGISYADNSVKILSVLNEQSEARLLALANELCGK